MCFVPTIPLTRSAKKKSTSKAVGQATRAVWHESVRRALRSLRKAKRLGGLWLLVPTGAGGSYEARLCRIVMGPFANDYPEGKCATNSKAWPTEHFCNTCWVTKSEVCVAQRRLRHACIYICIFRAICRYG